MVSVNKCLHVSCGGKFSLALIGSKTPSCTVMHPDVSVTHKDEVVSANFHAGNLLTTSPLFITYITKAVIGFLAFKTCFVGAQRHQITSVSRLLDTFTLTVPVE